MCGKHRLLGWVTRAKLVIWCYNIFSFQSTSSQPAAMLRCSSGDSQLGSVSSSSSGESRACVQTVLNVIRLWTSLNCHPRLVLLTSLHFFCSLINRHRWEQPAVSKHNQRDCGVYRSRRCFACHSRVSCACVPKPALSFWPVADPAPPLEK